MEVAIAGVATDVDYDLGEVARVFTLTGMDNVTAGSRLRYHVYLGTSATTKSFSGETSGTTNNTAVNYIDSRNGGAISTAITLVTTSTLGAGDGSITHLIVCPGNEAGDATSCASGPINDRGMGVAYVLATDNVTRVFINQDSTQSFAVVTADGSSDNVTATQTQGYE
jgi:hypothetical protein